MVICPKCGFVQLDDLFLTVCQLCKNTLKENDKIILRLEHESKVSVFCTACEKYLHTFSNDVTFEMMIEKKNQILKEHQCQGKK